MARDNNDIDEFLEEDSINTNVETGPEPSECSYTRLRPRPNTEERPTLLKKKYRSKVNEAAEMLDADFLGRLLDDDASVYTVNEEGMTPLHVAFYNEHYYIAATKRATDVLYSRIKNKIDFYPDNNGLSLFHIACSRNDIKTMEYLIAKGTYVNYRVKFGAKRFAGFTALHFAVLYHCGAAIKFLLKHGASLYINDAGTYGTPVHLAFKLCNENIIYKLLSNGIDVHNLRLRDKSSILHIFVGENRICERDHIEKITNFLLFFGCDVNLKNFEGNTPLHLVCSSRTSDMKYRIKALLESGADINIKNVNGKTPLEMDVPLTRRYRPIHIILFEHVKKLALLNYNVHYADLNYCNIVYRNKSQIDPEQVYFVKDKINNMMGKCREEIRLIRRRRLTRYLKLYNASHFKLNEMAIYSNIRKLRILLKEVNFQEKFSMYHSVMLDKWREGKVGRRELLEYAIGKYISPELCFDEIAEDTTDED